MDFEHEVREDPSAKGVEGYSPVHHFEAAGSGMITGAVDRIIEMKRNAAEYPLIKAGEVILKLA